jgi:hypothetical protein
MVLIKICQIYRRRLKIELENKEYEYGFYTGWKPNLSIGLNEISFVSAQKNHALDDCARGFSWGAND